PNIERRHRPFKWAWARTECSLILDAAHRMHCKARVETASVESSNEPGRKRDVRAPTCAAGRQGRSQLARTVAQDAGARAGHVSGAPLSAHAVRLRRQHLPASADMLGICL